MDLQFERSYPTPLTNSSLFPLLLLSLARQKHSPNTSTAICDKYDYVVVGGGTAGSVVASRLSEDPNVSVLLMEAGHKPPRQTEIPAISVYFQGTDVDWQFKSVPQKHAAQGVVNRQSYLAAGKMLGGSSNHNDMDYIRGNPKDYDGWEAMGAKGWSFKDVFTYFLKLEDNKSPEKLANGYHAVGGPITVEDSTYNPKLKQAFNEAAKSLGYKFVDPNGAQQTGFSCIQKNVRGEQRCSVVKGYLVHAENRTNLDILLSATVTKVILEGKCATGVEFYHNGKCRTVKANREVVLSAGTMNTPKLLMLSGIGPREELEKFDIHVVSDLPVGKNFHDHPVSLCFATKKPGSQSIVQQISDPRNIRQYINDRSGPLTDYFLMQAFLNGKSVTPDIDFPDYSVIAAEIPNILIKGLGLIPKIQKKFSILYGDIAVIACLPNILHPKSRGTVKLNSSDPFDSLLINPNYLGHPDDLKPFVKGFKLCEKLLASLPVSKLGVRPVTTLMPGCEKYHGSEDEYYSCYARQLTFTLNHYVGTCKMGDKTDPTTVVDPKLRVKNVEGLRVVDASIMPKIPSGNTHIPTVMIAEKASDLIKESIHCSKRNLP